MTSDNVDQVNQLCAELPKSEAELEHALRQLCENAMQQQDHITALTDALRANAQRARVLEAQIARRNGARST